MGLLQKLEKDKSILTNLNGATPQQYIGNTETLATLNPSTLYSSRLDLEGETPAVYDALEKNQLFASLTAANGAVSKYDLNGKTPSLYATNKGNSPLEKSLDSSGLDMNKIPKKYLDNKPR